MTGWADFVAMFKDVHIEVTGKTIRIECPNEPQAAAIEAAMRHIASDPYKDERCPERACDRCGKLYRGPAVYCSLACALADA